MAEEISTLVLSVRSEGIKDGTDQLNKLVDTSDKAETSVKKLGTAIAESGNAISATAGTTRAFNDANEETTKATTKLTLEQRKQVYEFNESAKAYKAAAVEAYKINAAIDANTTKLAENSKASIAAEQKIEAQARAYGLLQIKANELNVAYDKNIAVQKAAAAAGDEVARSTNTVALSAAQAAIQRKRNNDLLVDGTYSTVKLSLAQDEAIKINGKVTDSLNNIARGHGSNSAAIREALVLTHELSQGSYKRFGGSLLVLANQLDVIPKLFAAISEAGTATTFVVGGAAVVIAAFVVALAAIPIALAAGAAEQRKFNSALEESGNYAGLTAGGLANLAHQAVETGGSIGTANEAVILLASSGKFAGAQIGLIAEALEKTKRASGEAIDKSAKDFEQIATLAITSTARSTDVITKHVLQLNDHYHFLSAAQIEQISLLEKQGEAQKAAALAETLLAEEQIKRADKQIENLGLAEKAWNSLKETIGGVFHAVAEFGKKDDTSIILKRAQDNLRNAYTDANVTGSARVKLVSDLTAKLAVALDNDVKARATAAEKGNQQQLESDRAHAQRRLDTLYEAGDKRLKATRIIDELDRDYNKQSDDIKLRDKKKYETERAKLVQEQAGIKTDKTGDPDKLRRDKALADLEIDKRKRIESYEELLNTSKALGEEETSNRRSELDKRLTYYDEEKNAINEFYNKELDKLNAYHGKTQASREDNERKRLELRKQTEDASDKLDRRQNADVNAISRREETDAAAELKHIETVGNAETKRLERQLKADQIRLAGIGELKSAQLQAAADIEKEEESNFENSLDRQKEKLLSLLAEGDNPKQVAATAQAIAQGEKQLAIRKELLKIKDQEIDKQKKFEAEDRTTKNIDAALASAKRFQKGLSDAFGAVGKGIGGVSDAFAQLAKDQDAAQRKYNESSVEQFSNGEAQKTLDKENFDASIQGYGNLAEASKNFLDKKSAGYKIADGISKALHLAEVARDIASIAPKLAAGAATMFAQSGWGGFAGVAAMVAVMASFGFGGGHGSGGGKSAEEVQKAQGTGSVFGDSTAKSDSVNKSLEKIQNNTGLLIPINSSQLEALRAIQTSLGGLANLVVRTPGLTQGTNLGIKEGTSGPSGVIANELINHTLLGNLLPGLVKSLFGKTTQTIIDSGIQFKGALRDLQSGKGIEQYATVNTTKSSFFGLSKKTSSSVQTAGLGADLSQQFGLVFKNIEDVLKASAPALGKTGDEVVKAINNFTLPLTQISLKDLKGEDLTKAINGVISKALDDVAQAALPGYERFAKVGEGYAETLIRVTSDILQTKQVFELLGKTLSLTDGRTADTVESLISLSGGIDKLTSNTKKFADDFLTSAEKLAPQQKALQNALNELGLGSIKTDEQFKNLVISQDLSTAAGQALYVKLLELAPVFKEVSNAVKQALEESVNAVDSALKSLDASINAEKDKLNKQRQDELKKSEDVHNLALKNIENQSKEQQDSVNAIQKVLDDIQNSIEATAAYDQVQARKKALEIVQSAASAKDITKVAGLEDAIKELAKPSEQLFSSLADFNISQAQANNALQHLKDTGTIQLTDAQKQLAALEDLKDAEDIRFEKEQADIDVKYDGQIKALDDIFANAQSQLDALKGIDNSVKSVAQALSTVNSLLAAAQSIKSGSTGVSAPPPQTGTGNAGIPPPSTPSSPQQPQNNESFVENLYQVILGRHSDPKGLSDWVRLINSGVSRAEVINYFYKSDEYVGKHPSFDVGTNNVPEDMVANIHKGERIIPAADNAELMRRLSKEEIKDDAVNNITVSDKLDVLIDAIMRGDQAIVQKINDIYRINRDWDGNGLPPTRSS